MANSPKKDADPAAKNGNFFIGLMAGLSAGSVIAALLALYISHLGTPIPAKIANASAAAPVDPRPRPTDAAKRGFLNPEPVTGSVDSPESNHLGTETSPAVLSSPAALNASSSASSPTTALTPEAKSELPLTPTKPTVSSMPATLGEELHPVTVRYFIQTGAYEHSDEAENQRANLALLGIDSTIVPSTSEGTNLYYRVRVGPFTSVDEVRTMVKTLKDNSIPTQVLRETTTSRSSLIPRG